MTTRRAAKVRRDFCPACGRLTAYSSAWNHGQPHGAAPGVVGPEHPGPDAVPCPGDHRPVPLRRGWVVGDVTGVEWGRIVAAGRTPGVYLLPATQHPDAPFGHHTTQETDTP